VRSPSPILVLALLLGTATAARAETDKARADASFEEGKRLLQAGDWPGACASFEASFAADPAVSAAVKIARCNAHDGKLVAALAEYRRALELNHSLQQTPQRVKELEALITSDLAALEPRIPKLSLVMTPRPSGLEVSVNGTLVPGESLAAPFPVDPGETEIIVRAPGYREQRLTPRIAEGVLHELSLELVAEPPPASAVAPSAPAPVPAVGSQVGLGKPVNTDVLDREAGSGQRTLGVVVGGAGALALGVAAYFGVKTLVLVDDAAPHCPGNACDHEGYGMIQDAGDAQTLGFVSGGLGAALVATGAVLYLTAPSARTRPSPTATARLGPAAVRFEATF